jgi:LacI family transcriptional regulator
MSVNLKELSARLGLSPTTVSRALGGYSDVSPVTKERVHALARELGYQPNRAARQIALGRADAVGIVYPLDSDTLGNPAFLEMLSALSQGLERANIDLLLLAAPTQGSAEMRTYERMVRERRVDAAVVALTRVEDPRIEYLLSAGLPFVAYGRSRKAERYPWFDFDNRAGGRMAVQQLAALGHQRIAYVHAPLQLNFARQRYDGFVQGMRAAGLPVVTEMMLPAALDRRTGYQAGQRLLQLKPRPTAVVVDSSLSGVGVVRALIDADVAVGRELSVLVYEGVPADTLLRGLQVAAIVQPTPSDSGRTIGEMLLALIQGQPMAAPHVLRQPEFRAGDSIAPPVR